MITLPGIWRHSVKVIRFYLETKQVNKKGKPVKIPVVQRSLFLTCSGGWDTEPRRLKVFQVNRHGETTYSVTCIPVVKQPWWNNPNGTKEHWYKEVETYKVNALGEDILQWKKFCPSMDEVGIKQWLKWRVGDKADAVFNELVTSMPISLEEAA